MSRLLLALLFGTTAMTAGVSDPIVALRALTGQQDQYISAMSLDRNGNVVVAGWTSAALDNMPSGGAAPTRAGGTDGFIACLTPDLKTVLAFTYVGGDSADAVHGMAVAPSGEIWVTGTTRSSNLPVTPNKGGRLNANGDAFVLKYSSDLKNVTGGRYLAGDQVDEALSISCTAQNTAVVCGRTRSSSGLPDPGGHDRSANGGWDGFITTIAMNGADVDMFTFYGGNGDDELTTVATDATGTICAAGTTTSNDLETFPRKTLVWVDDGGGRGGGSWKEVGNNAFDVDFNGGTSDAIVLKLQGDGTLLFATYLGGSGIETPRRALLDAEGNVVVAGTTTSANFPIPEAGTSAFGGGTDIFLASISTDGLRQRLGRFLGGDGDDAAGDMTFDATGRPIITGWTSSSDLTNVGVGSSASNAGAIEGLLCVVGTNDIAFFTTFGWNRDDMPTSLVRDARGDCYIAGATASDLPSHTANGPTDAFVMKRVFGLLDFKTPITAAPLCVGASVSLTWTTSDIPSTATFNVEASLDGGETWSPLVAATKARTYTWMVPAAPASGKIHVRVVSSHGHVATPGGPYDVSTAPTITEHPASGTYCPASRIELAPVLVSSDQATYQWRKNGVNIDGATGATLVIASATGSDAADYDVVITTPCGSVTSNAATIRVQAQPLITQQPASVNVAQGAVVTLVVMAEGEGLRLQWMKNGVDIDGATSFNLILTNVTAEDEGDYACKVSSACGTTTSETARVSVGTTSVMEHDLSTFATVSPLPASDHIAVHMSRTTGSPAHLLVRDLRGIVCASVHMDDATQQIAIPVTALATGSYRLELHDGFSVSTMQIMIMR